MYLMDATREESNNRMLSGTELSMPKISEGYRVLWADIFKGAFMLFIILLHVGCAELYQRIYTPIFLSRYFWISGYMTKNGRPFMRFIFSKM